MRPAKTQISQGVRPVWSESSLSAWRKLWSLATHWAHSKDSDKTGRMKKAWVFSKDWLDWADAQADLSLRLAHSHFVGFLMRRLICQLIFLLFSESISVCLSPHSNNDISREISGHMSPTNLPSDQVQNPHCPRCYMVCCHGNANTGILYHRPQTWRTCSGKPPASVK